VEEKRNELNGRKINEQTNALIKRWLTDREWP
jgi:hypothetical protein